MPRTTHQPPEGAEAIRPDTDINSGALEALSCSATVMGEAERMACAMSGELNLVNQLLGQAQAAQAIQKFSALIGISKLAFVKKNKHYRALKGSNFPLFGEIPLRGTWEEFCQLLGISVDKADSDIANFHAFGEEALDAMSQMGIGYRELRQLRQLPEDQRAALIETARAGDKDTLLELAEDLIAKHAREKDELVSDLTEREAALASTKADLEAARKRADARQKRIDALEDEREKLQQVIAKADPDERRNALLLELTRVTARLDETIRGDLWATISALREHEDATDIPIEGYLRGVMATLRDGIADLEEAFNIRPEIGVEYPPYLLDQIDAAAPTDRNGPDDVAH